MRHFFIAAALAAAVSLGGCATTGGGGAADIIKQVQDYARQACGFLPEASGVAAVISAMYPAGAAAAVSAIQVGSAICAGLSPPAARRAGVAVKEVKTPKGIITVRGQYVR